VLFNELLVLFQVQYRLFSFAGAIAIALYICMCDHRRRPKHTHTNLSRCNEVASIPVLPSENACGKQIFCCSPPPPASPRGPSSPLPGGPAPRIKYSSTSSSSVVLRCHRPGNRKFSAKSQSKCA